MNPGIYPHIRHSTRYVGRSVPRREDRGPLTGGSRYIADVRIAEMLEVVFVRSTEAHALSEWGVDLAECPVTPVAVRDALRAAGAPGDTAALG